MSAAAIPSAGSRITLRGALIALGVLLVIINVGSAVWDALTDRERTELRAQRDFSNLTSLLAEQTASALEAVDLVLREAVREGSAAKVAGAAPRLRDEMVHVPQVAAFLVLDESGRVLARTNETPSIDAGLANRPFFTAHRDGRTEGLFLSEPYHGGPGGTKWRFVMSRRLAGPGGTFSGVIAAVMELETFDRLYRAIDLGDGGFITLRSQEGTIITRVPDPAGSRGRGFPNPDIDAGLRREGRFTGWTMSPILNERVLVAASAVRGFPMHILSGATEQSVFAPWRGEASRIAARTLLTSVAMLVLIALAAWGLARRERALQRERKLAEAERRGCRLGCGRREKMEAVGRLAGGIAHDFNNILGGLLGYSRDGVRGGRGGHAHEALRAQPPHGGEPCARPRRPDPHLQPQPACGKHTPVEIGRIVGETLDLVRGSLAAGIALDLELPATPLVVVGDPTQLHQVVMNLCTNAIQAMSGSGTLRVALEAADGGRARARARGACPGALRAADGGRHRQRAWTRPP